MPPGRSDLPFWFDVEEELTGDDAAMAAVAEALDEADTYEKSQKERLIWIQTQ